MCLSVFEEPCIMTNILSFLSPRDVVNLKLTNGIFTKEERFIDLYKDYMDVMREEHYHTLEIRRKMEFNKRLKEFIVDGSTISCAKCREMFDYMIKHMDILESSEYSMFVRIIHDKLIQFLDDDEFVFDAVYYLEEMFGIYPKARDTEDEDGYEEYIEDMDGNITII